MCDWVWKTTTTNQHHLWSPDDRSRLVNIVASRFSVLIHYLEVTVASLHYTVRGHGGPVATPPSVPQLMRRVPAGHRPVWSIWIGPRLALGLLQCCWRVLAQWNRAASSSLCHFVLFLLLWWVLWCLASFTYWLAMAYVLSLKDGKGNRVPPRGWMGLWNPSRRMSFSKCGWLPKNESGDV